MYPTKTITITKLDIKEFPDNKKFIVTDQNGDRYNFKEKKTDGMNTKAFLAFSNVGVRAGSTYEITYNEQRKEFNGHPYTDRVIFDFKPTNGTQPSQGSSQEKSSNIEANRGQSAKSDEFWEQQAYEKCAWSHYVEVNKGNLTDFKSDLLSGIIWEAFQVIKTDSKKRFSQVGPTDDDLNVEDIPF